MKFSKGIHAIDSHTMGEPTRIVVGGIPQINGETMADKKKYLEDNLDYVRTALMHEPRGHNDMFGSIITSSNNKEADFGIIFMDGGGYLNMCGHGSIGAATVAVETGMVEMVEPVTNINMEAPAGLIKAKVMVENEKVKEVSITNVPSFLYMEDATLEVPSLNKTITFDISFGGSFFAIVHAKELGVKVETSQVDVLKKLGIEIRDLITTDITRDFNNAIADSIQVQFYMPSGDYQVDVVPELDTLEFTIIKSYGVNVELIERFKFIVLNNTSAKMGSVTENQKKEELNKQSMQVVVGQAVNILYYATRLITVTKALRGVTLQEAISFSFNDFINNPRDIKINGTPIKLDKLNIDPPNNPNRLNNLILPSHVTVYDMPTELQDKYGVYNGHIGTYITRDYKNGISFSSICPKGLFG